MPYIQRLVAPLDPSTSAETGEPSTLDSFLDFRGIVLLGDPGMGKTEELRQLAAAAGTRVTTVQEIIHRVSCDGNRLFLDALDEARGGGGTVGAVLAKLVDWGSPTFILSCRIADWFGGSDLRQLSDVYGDQNIKVVRLLGFTNEQAKEFLSGSTDDPDRFIREAKQRGLDDLLANPNDLLLLASIAGNGWPANRRDLYHQSSLRFAKERDPGRAITLPRLGDDALLDTAGAACASLLISGKQGICLDDAGEIDPNYGALTEFAADPILVETLAKSNLFVGTSPRHVRPRHRTTAEFLAGRWLARKVTSGRMTLRRLLSVIAPEGRPPTELRGTAAWLITHVPGPDAERVIETDPFGLLVYGDAETFDRPRLRALLRAIKRLAMHEPYFRVSNWMDRPWLAFIRPELAPEIAAILNEAEPNPHLLDGLLAGLANGQRIPDVLDAILSVLANRTVHVEAKKRAVRAYLNQGGVSSELQQIFEDCSSGVVPDNDGQLRLEIYRRCQAAIGAARLTTIIAELWDERDLTIGSLHYGFIDEIPSDHLATMLDGLAEEHERRRNPYSAGGLSAHYCGFEIRHFLEKALLRLAAEERASVEKLARWRRLMNASSVSHESEWQQFWNRVNEDGTLFKYIFDNEVVPGEPSNLRRRFFDRVCSHNGLVTPSDASIEFLINRAADELDDETAAAIASCATVYFPWHSERRTALFDLALRRWSGRTCLAPHFEGLTYCEIPDWRREQAQKSQQHRLHADQERTKFRAWVSDNLQGIHDWTAFNALDQIGRLYFFGSNAGSRTLRRDALVQLLGQKLAEDVEQALVDGFVRARLPSASELGTWKVAGQSYTAQYAVLAAMELLLERAPDTALPPDTIKSIIALMLENTGVSNLESSQGTDRPTWLEKQLDEKPDLCASTAGDFFHATAQNGDRLSGLHALLSPASRATIELARTVLAMNPSHVDDLELALHALLDGGERQIVADVAQQRLAATSLNQPRAFWAAIGWLAAPQAFRETFARELQACPQDEAWTGMRTIFPDRHRAKAHPLSTQEAGWLAEQIGARFSLAPRPRGTTSGSTNPWDASELVDILLDKISADPSATASADLKRLAETPALASYRTSILHALAMQRSRFRDTQFNAPSLPILKDVFGRHAVASADELVAVTRDELDALQAQYRGGDTTGWNKFWNTGKNGIITDPRIEDHCRNILIDDLRPRLAVFCLNVNHSTTAHGGNEADSSIETTGPALHLRVPIEMKMATNRELWRASREQLSAKYMVDPLSGGRGVYIVFWTGSHGVPAPPENLERPKSPDEMHAMLRGLLSEAERRQISICVLDVSPNRTSSTRAHSSVVQAADHDSRAATVQQDSDSAR